MKLLLERRFKGEAYTVGTLYVNGERFCDTLEDRVRDLAGGEVKVPGETAIPEGVYKVIAATAGRAAVRGRINPPG